LTETTPPSGAGRQREKLDLTAFTAYLLGAIVPLVALGAVVDRYVLPTLDDRLEAAGLIGLLISIALLSLGSFLVLRRSTHRSLRRMNADNERLAALLRSASALAESRDHQTVMERASAAALELSGADAAFVLLGSGSDALPIPACSAGERAAELYEAEGPGLAEILRLVLDQNRSVLRGADSAPLAPADGAPAAPEKSGGPAIALPIPGPKGTPGVLLALRARGAAAFDAGPLDALSTLAALSSVALHNADLVHAQRNFFAHVTELLSQALDNHLDYHRGHGKRVAQLAHLVGRELGMGEDAMHRLHFGALLHDIGMLKMDRAQKMNARSCERHAALGARMLAPIVLWQDVAPIVHSHHERWDGRGYPDGLAGDSIPLESRVIALADAYDSIASHSSYRVALGRAEAIQELRECTGTQFDPRVFAAFLAIAERGELGPEE